MNEMRTQIAAREKELGRSLSPIEKMTFAAPGKRLGSQDDEDYRIILTETHEGIALKEAFDKSVQEAELVHNLQLRHTAALSFNQAKRALLRDFRDGKIERIKPKAE